MNRKKKRKKKPLQGKTGILFMFYLFDISSLNEVFFRFKQIIYKRFTVCGKITLTFYPPRLCYGVKYTKALIIPDREIYKKKMNIISFYIFCLDFGFRLSSVAGERLRFNNPAIADLSDENRPNKLAEKFSELYDNEWTEFYENMEGTGTEEEIIGQIVQLLKVYKITTFF